MPKRKKQQRVILVIEEGKFDQVSIDLSFYPPLAGEKKFEELPIRDKEMQNMAAQIGKYVMERLAQNNKGKFKEKANG